VRYEDYPTVQVIETVAGKVRDREFKVHPVADMFPMLDDEAYAELRDDISKNGQQQPIIIDYYEDDQEKMYIIDGRNRMKAIRELGHGFYVEEYKRRPVAKMKDIGQFILSLNLTRRHLTTAQKAVLANKLRGTYEAEAELRKQSNLKQNTDKENFPERGTEPEGQSRDLAGEQLGVSGKSVDKAREIAEKAPDVIKRIESGKVTSLGQAETLANLPEDQRKQALEEIDAGEAAKDVVKKVKQGDSSDERYTPVEYLASAKAVMGRIDLDPASCKAANERHAETLGELKYFSKEDDGLERDWKGNIWLNPPYSRGLINRFVDKLLTEIETGNLSQAVVLVNNGTDTEWFQHLLEACKGLIFPNHRIHFFFPDGTQKKQTRQGQAIFYFGSKHKAFINEFAQYGVVLKRAR
jgi:ParB family chromosome partitioning protein